MASRYLLRDSDSATWCQASTYLHDSFSPMACMSPPPNQHCVACSYTLPSLAASLRYSLGPFGPQLLNVEPYETPPERFLLVSDVGLFLPDFSSPANQHIMS